MDYKTRKLTANDVKQYRDIRLEALQLSSENYGSSYEDESAESDEFFIKRIQDGFILGAFAGETLIATTGFFQNKGKKRHHVGNIWGVYTKPDYRNQGLSKRLMHEAYKHLPNEIEILHLGVRATNTIAHEFYKKEGFYQYGLDEKATKINGEYIDEILMMKYL